LGPDRFRDFRHQHAGRDLVCRGRHAFGPLGLRRKIVTHDTYSFYNPKQHPYFDRDNGRIIYFEGTYTHTFSGSKVQTPHYDYNQIMYKLDLSDPRLVLPVPVYSLNDKIPSTIGTTAACGFALSDGSAHRGVSRQVSFFACDRPAPGLVTIIATGDRGYRAAVPAENLVGTVMFHALPADAKDPPATTIPLFVYSQGRNYYLGDESTSAPGYRRADQPLCRVWKSPTRLRFPWIDQILLHSAFCIPHSSFCILHSSFIIHLLRLRLPTRRPAPLRRTCRSVGAVAGGSAAMPAPLAHCAKTVKSFWSMSRSFSKS